jgi:hypothetical protein
MARAGQLFMIKLGLTATSKMLPGSSGSMIPVLPLDEAFAGLHAEYSPSSAAVLLDDASAHAGPSRRGLSRKRRRPFPMRGSLRSSSRVVPSRERLRLHEGTGDPGHPATVPSRRAWPSPRSPGSSTGRPSTVSQGAILQLLEVTEAARSSIGQHVQIGGSISQLLQCCCGVLGAFNGWRSRRRRRSTPTLCPDRAGKVQQLRDLRRRAMSGGRH